MRIFRPLAATRETVRLRQQSYSDLQNEFLIMNLEVAPDTN